ncbi:MAG: inorganic phosphate transporter [Archaeoglobales archaeon]|nr:MAG: inorganic phosphate transporter [Archaeoglobales archaeon]
MDFILPILIVGLYMAWNIGANDAANSMGTSYGSKALTIKQIIFLACILEFLGASFFGHRVTHTIAKGIVPIEFLSQDIVILGAFASILSASLWVTIATYYGLPVSTSHSIVGAVLGFGIAAWLNGLLDLDAIKWFVLLRIILSWVLSPFFGALLGFLTFYLIRKILLENFDVTSVERVFRYLQVLSACFVAFAHGSNDVANAVGPVCAAFGYAETPPWILMLGGLGIAVGIATWGYRVMEVVGKRITELTWTRGFSAEFSTATTVLAASYLGMPISTTHTIVGSVIGVGLARGIASIDLRIVGTITISWLLTIPITTVLTTLIYYILIILG